LKSLYEQGHSLKEIAAQTNIPFGSVRRQLLKQDVTLRPNKSVSFKNNLRQSFKSSTQPPFGYCYLEGRLQKDPREFSTFQIIEKQTALGRTPTEIAKYLNGKKLKTRKGVDWKQAHVFNIVQRIKNNSNKES
jgi:hypothetical protein